MRLQIDAENLALQLGVAVQHLLALEDIILLQFLPEPLRCV